MAIQSVNQFIDAVGGEQVGPSGAPATPDYEDAVEWGPATSLAGQDAFSRLGIEAGMPKAAHMVKTSAAFHGISHEKLAAERQEMVKEALGGAILSMAAKPIMKGVQRFMPKAVTGLASRIGKSAPAQWMQRAGAGLANLGKKEILPAGGRASAVARGVRDIGTDVGIEGYDVMRAKQHKDPLFTQLTGIGKPTTYAQQQMRF